MSAGGNAVKGKQGFQTTEKPSADLADLEVRTSDDGTAETTAMHSRISALWDQRDGIAEQISLLSAKTLAMETRQVWPDAATIELSRDDSSESLTVGRVLDANGEVVAEWMDDNEVDLLQDAASGIQLGRDHSERFLVALDPGPGGRSYRDVNADDIDVERALALDV